jgi:predicted nucleotide-binding protein (sugar kinase/HSP70/actin superfamily)
MLNLLLKLKAFIPVICICAVLSAILYGQYWHTQYNKSQANNAQLIQQLANCNANQQLLESAVQRWKTAADQYDEQLKRKEAVVAKQTVESDKRVKTILQDQYSVNCNEAIQQGIQKSIAYQFHWVNNIP